MSGNLQDGWPLTLTRRMEDFPVANITLGGWLKCADETLADLINSCRYPWDLLAINEKIVGEMSEDKI